jgi:hypothetical protein
MKRFIICTLNQYYYSNKIEEDEICGASSTYNINENFIKNFSQET